MGIRCGSCGHEVAPKIVFREGDILRCKRTGRLAVAQTDRHLSTGRIIDVVILTGDHKGRNSVWMDKNVEVVHGYFHIDQRVK